ncbi:alpha/beta hydrolase [Massilia sp. YIM B02769]|uniref:alpha/beta fold hydrolase n=1 Tax=unclassified Massilia TaxID=2609279 RepID=UPI0025B7089E|nr:MULTISPECIES: alpha/beta hydrolase [unclassified Massilia]MDN4059068.1 alpha/beta hydrolase [Massilia sp. YIM B02769]
MKAALLFALILGAGAPAFAQDAPQPANRFAATIAPAERFDIKGMLVERHGNGAKPLVLIPGLATGGWVWQETVRELGNGHTIYVVTLPGFDGRPVPAGDAAAENRFMTAKATLAELISSRHLAKPVLIGHSIGATLSIALAEDLPDALGGVVAIDGLPVFPRTEDMPTAQRPAMGEAVRKQMAAAVGPAFAAQQRQYMRTMGVVDMGKADDIAKLTARSDPLAVADYAGAVMALDLRADLPKIRVPVLVLAPSFGPDEALTGMSGGEKVAYYRELMTGTPKLDVKLIDNARHFAMLDQPRAVNDALRQFLNNL